MDPLVKVLRQRIGLAAATVAFAVVLALPVPDTFLESAKRLGAAGASAEVAASARAVLAIALAMVLLWMTEAVPLATTALLPAVLFPVLGVVGVRQGALAPLDVKTTLASYAHPIIFLFVGSFLLTGAMRKWGLDRRIALAILSRRRIAGSTRWTLFALMLTTALISMWVSNTATTAMMLPIALGIASRGGGSGASQSSFGTALVLGVAWAATLGGLATPIGTPPNGITLSILEGAGFAAPSFGEWMAIGVPVSLLLLGVAFGVLLWKSPPEARSLPGGAAQFEREREELGPWSRGEVAVAVFFGFAVLGWIALATVPSLAGLSPKSIGVDESVVALGAGLFLFVIPAGRGDPRHVLEARDWAYVEWPTLLLFGGGIALSEGIFGTGLASVIGRGFVGLLGEPPVWVLLTAVVLLITLLSEIASNTAIASMMVPVILAVAGETGADPASAAMTVAFASSFGFMLPVATAPNALAYATGYVSFGQMVRAGVWLDILCWAVGTPAIYLFGVVLFGILR